MSGLFFKRMVIMVHTKTCGNEQSRCNFFCAPRCCKKFGDESAEGLLNRQNLGKFKLKNNKKVFASISFFLLVYYSKDAESASSLCI